MTRDAWIRRSAGLGVLVCAGLILSSAAQAVLDLNAVAAAGSRLRPPPSPASSQATSWRAPKPVLRSPAGQAKARLNEYLNGQLPSLGLTLTTVDIGEPRPLGEGLALAEVRVSGHADASALMTLTQWVAVNRDSVRLSAVTAGLDPQGDGAFTAVLLVVIA